MIKKKQLHTGEDMSTDVQKAGQDYKTYYDRVLVREQPFYHSGITDAEVTKEIQYLNDNLKEFYEGRYVPLWKQDWFK